MRRLHIALAVRDLRASIADYTRRLGVEPCCVVEGAYALWRTGQVNLSITADPAAAGSLRHLGFEDPEAPAMGVDSDPDGIVWERFTERQQRQEILARWPRAQFRDGSFPELPGV